MPYFYIDGILIGERAAPLATPLCGSALYGAGSFCVRLGTISQNSLLTRPWLGLNAFFYIAISKTSKVLRDLETFSGLERPKPSEMQTLLLKIIKNISALYKALNFQSTYEEMKIYSYGRLLVFYMAICFTGKYDIFGNLGSKFVVGIYTVMYA